MSSNDYQHRSLLQADAEAGKHLTDDDVDWLLALLRQPSRSEYIHQDLVLLVILQMHYVSLSQQRKIREAMRPLLASGHPRTAQVVIHKLNTMDGETATR